MRILTKHLTSALCLWSICFGSSWAKTPELSQHTVRYIQRAIEAQQADKLAEAIQILEKLEPSRAYDLAYVSRILGVYYWHNQQPESAIKHLTLAADSGALPEEQSVETEQMLADILLAEGRYNKSELRYLSLVSQLESVKDKEWLWLRISQTQYQQQKWRSVEQSVAKQQKFQFLAGIKPKTAPLNMLLGAQLAQKKWGHAIPTTSKLRELEPENYLWWRQLVTLYMYSNNPKKALATLQQAERAGFTLEKHQMKLMAQLYGQSGVPYKAAEVYSRIGDSEKSASLLEQQAIYWQQAKEWEKTVQAIDKIEAPGARVLLIKARALNAIGKDEQALKAATQAHRLNPSEESLSWIKYLDH